MRLSGQLAGQKYLVVQTIRRLPEKERVQKFKEMAAANKNAIAAVLTQDQTGRLRQIALQQKGPHAFSDPEVVKALALDKGQKLRIRAIQEQTRLNMAKAGAPRQAHGLEALLRRAKDLSQYFRNACRIWNRAREEIVALLKPEQKAAWQALTGEPFRGRTLPVLVTAYAVPGTVAKVRHHDRDGEHEWEEGKRHDREEPKRDKKWKWKVFKLPHQGGKDKHRHHR
jgi:hypothetical protein